MGAARSPSLTKLSFRRDVRLFLTLLVGLLVVLIVVLLLVLGRTSSFAAESTMRHRLMTAEAAADALVPQGSDELPAGLVESRLVQIRTRYGVEAVSFRSVDGRVTTSGMTEGLAPAERRLRGGTLTLYFDDTRLMATRRSYVLVGIICAAATIAGAFLLAMYLPKITRPVELMLDQAREAGAKQSHEDDTEFVVDTFRRSVAVLKSQEEELRRLHALQKSRADDLERVTAALTRSLTSGFVAIDRGGLLVDANAAAREIAGLSDASVQGQPIEQVFGQNAFSTLLRDALERRTALSRTEAHVAFGEEKRLIGLTTVPLLNEEQQFLGMLALFTDLTPIRQLETRVREMQNLADLGEIAAGIAHEFRNSLSTILGYLRLSRKAAAQPATIDAIEKAEREAAGLSAAVDGLLSFAKPMKLDAKPVDLFELACSVAERLAVGSGVDVHCEGQAAIIEGDPVLLDRAVENVVRNAVDSVRRKGAGGAVDVRVTAHPVIAIEVEDSGVGVDPSEVASFFLPFRSGTPGGHGLGLSLARKIVLLHGGTIRLTGEPGRGATAIIEFPGLSSRA
ncbi:MAG TPA: ATP-binding protein [Thermoanaerobaculia bacterium]|nr:ATP-binding protein [Thermoanaerobaculia bacterium]